MIQIGNIKGHEKLLLRFTLPSVRRSLNNFARKNVPESVGEARDKNHSARDSLIDTTTKNSKNFFS